MKAPGTVPTTSKPSERHSPTARSLVSTTALNWMPSYPSVRAHAIMSSPSARPTPLTRQSGSTMKLAVAMCAPRPGLLGPIFAEPRTLGPSTATTVRPGASSIHHGLASSSSSPVG